MPEEDTKKQIGTRIRAAREQSGLSQGQAAKLLEMHRPTISEIEAGRRKVSADELIALSRLYDVSVAWLIETTSEIPDPRIELAARELVKTEER